MAKTDGRNLEPQQMRSRESLRKLLRAAREVLGQRGLAETTIPRIAAHAGLTPGAVYRRFRDKEALLEAAILGMLERQAEHMKAGLTPEAVAQIPLAVFVEQIVGSMVVTYRANAPLLRGMRMFARSRRGSPFWKKASRLEIRAYERLIDLLLTHRHEMRHPDPEGAISFGLFMLVSSLVELMEDPAYEGPWKRLLPRDDAALKRELTRAFLSYVGAGGSDATSRR